MASRLESIPFALRQQIFHHLLQGAEVRITTNGFLGSPNSIKQSNLQNGLLLASKKLSSEALLVLEGHLRLVFTKGACPRHLTLTVRR